MIDSTIFSGAHCDSYTEAANDTQKSPNYYMSTTTTIKKSDSTFEQSAALALKFNLQVDSLCFLVDIVAL
jgi:hypothetical protein